MKKITPFLLGLGLTLIMVGGFLSSSPKDVGAATVVSLGKNGTSEYLLYPTDTLSAYTFIATSTTASSSFANGINLTNGCFAIGSVCLPTVTTLGDYLSLSSWYATTTDGLDEGLTNLYFTNPRVQTYLDTLSKGYFFSTTSADAWDSTKSRWSTTSNTYWLTQQTTDGLAQGSTNKYFANSLVDTWLGTKNLGVFWSTTSADAWHLTKEDVSFSTTSADYWVSLFDKGYFFSTTSADHWLTTQSITSASSTLLGDNNLFSGNNIFNSITRSTSTQATSTNFFSTYVVGTNGTITNLLATNSTTTNATSTNLYVSGNSAFYGNITASSTQPATSTTITLDWSLTSPQVEYRIGTSATTITLINATTSIQWGSRKLVWVCNPNGVAGALTWVGVEWIGNAPTQTTTANVCDVYSFDITRATSSTAYKVAGSGGTNFK